MAGQALVEVAILLPVLLGVVLGGLTLSRLAVSQAEVHVAAIVAAAAADPAVAARAQLERNRLVDPEQTSVQVRQVGQLRLVTVTARVSSGWWPGAGGSPVKLTAVAGRGRALWCMKSRR
jgi:hypothetical protein